MSRARPRSFESISELNVARIVALVPFTCAGCLYVKGAEYANLALDTTAKILGEKHSVERHGGRPFESKAPLLSRLRGGALPDFDDYDLVLLGRRVILSNRFPVDCAIWYRIRCNLRGVMDGAFDSAPGKAVIRVFDSRALITER